jgi:hypothetical protein
MTNIKGVRGKTLEIACMGNITDMDIQAAWYTRIVIDTRIKSKVVSLLYRSIFIRE